MRGSEGPESDVGARDEPGLVVVRRGGGRGRAPPSGVPARPRQRGRDDLPVASDVRLAGDDSLTRFVVDLAASVDIRAFTLANPYRVVIDMPQVTFQLPAEDRETGRGLIKAFRFGLVMQGGSRMVIDLARPARIDKAFVLDAANDQPARLVLDLAATDRESFLRTIALDSRPPEPRQTEAPAERQAEQRSAAADRDRSRPWRHRQRHQGAERRAREEHRARFLPGAAATRSRRPANTAW